MDGRHLSYAKEVMLEASHFVKLSALSEKYEVRNVSSYSIAGPFGSNTVGFWLWVKATKGEMYAYACFKNGKVVFGSVNGRLFRANDMKFDKKSFWSCQDLTIPLPLPEKFQTSEYNCRSVIRPDGPALLEIVQEIMFRLEKACELSAKAIESSRGSLLGKEMGIV